MIFGAIMAGGVGSRMKISDCPKQFLPLGDKPIIIHTLEKFLMCQRFDRVYVGVHPTWVQHTHELVKKHLSQFEEKIRLVPGGNDRNETLMNVIDAIEGDNGVNEENIIVTHDAVRPFVTARIINYNIDAALEFDACDTVCEAVDTIVESKNADVITSIPERKYMYQGQTPQSFKISLLKRLYGDLSDDERAILTDACKICVMRDQPVKLVRGEVSNLKITTVNDYKIAKIMATGSFE